MMSESYETILGSLLVDCWELLILYVIVEVSEMRVLLLRGSEMSELGEVNHSQLIRLVESGELCGRGSSGAAGGVRCE